MVTQTCKGKKVPFIGRGQGWPWGWGKEGKRRGNLGKKEGLPAPFPFRTFLPPPNSPLHWSSSAAWRLQRTFGHNNKKGSTGHEREGFDMSSSHTQIACLTGCTLYFFITCCICLLYQTAKQPLFVWKSRTQVWSNKRPGASSRVQTKCKTWEILKIHFFSLPIHAPKLERFCAKIPCGCLEKKKNDFEEKNPDCFAVYYLVNVKVNF